MAEYVEIPVADLLFDVDNPRLPESQASQQAAALELAQRQGEGLLRLAEDIVEHGLDPTTLMAVVATGDRRKRYDILEGNRRALALRALESPALVASVLTPARNRKLASLARRYAADPIDKVTCVLFPSEDEARHWVELRHTGQNLGVGLWEWGSEEKDRYQARHTGTRSRGGQVLEFVEKHGSLSNLAKSSPTKVLTNVERLVKPPWIRKKLGLDFRDGRLVALYPADELKRGLSRIVEDLKTGKIVVRDIYHDADRRSYIDSLPASVFPKKSKALKDPVFLDDLTTGVGKAKPAPKPPPPKPRPRTTVVPAIANLNVTPPRINDIYVELSAINAERYPNACSVLLRVFIELSVDHYLEDKKLMSDAVMRNTVLAKRLKKVVDDLHSRNRISAQFKRAMDAYADGNRTIVAAPITTFNQYVHNQYVYPRPADLFTTWDELAPLLVKLWP